MRCHVSICGNRIASESGSPVGTASRAVFALRRTFPGGSPWRLPIRRRGNIGAESGLEGHPTPGDPGRGPTGSARPCQGAQNRHSLTVRTEFRSARSEGNLWQPSWVSTLHDVATRLAPGTLAKARQS